MVLILKKKSVRGARGVGAIGWLPSRNVFKLLLMHVSGQCTRVREIPGPDIRSQTNITKVEQIWDSSTPYGINVGLGIEKAGLKVTSLSNRWTRIGLNRHVTAGATSAGIHGGHKESKEPKNLTAAFKMLLIRSNLGKGDGNSNLASASRSLN
jgi:hypothetical protein